ncbi:MAG: beta strand repeat-containing protein [Holosporales bacterium]
MTTVVINKPGADTTVSYDIASGDKIVFKTPLKTLKMNMVGSDMVVYWPDGGKVVLVGAGLSMFNAEDTTLFETVGGKIMTGNELLAQMGKLETVLASEIDKISAVFEEKKQDTTADSKEIQQLKSLLNEKSATPSFKAIDEVLSPTDALNPEANQSKLQDAMRKADETFRRVQDEDGFHGRYNMISAPPITPVDPGLPPPEPAKPEYFSFFVQHVGANGNFGGTGGSGQTPAARFSPENLTGSGEIYGDDPVFTSTLMQQQIVFRVNDIAEFEDGFRRSGLLQGFLQASKVTLEASAGWPDGVELFYYDSSNKSNTVVLPVGNVYTFDASINAPGLSTNSIIITIQYPGTASVGSGFNVVTKVEFIDDATVDVPPEQGGPTVVYTYNAEGQPERFKFINPATGNQNDFSGFAFPVIPVGTNITGSSGDDTIIPGIGQSGTTAVTLDGKGGNDKVDYGEMFDKKQADHAPLEITMTSGLNSQVRMTVNGNKFLHSNLKNIETIVGGDGDDTLYGSVGTAFRFDGGVGIDTLDMSKASGSGSWVFADFRASPSPDWSSGKNIENYVGSTSNIDFVIISTGLDTSQGVVHTIDGGAGWGNYINWLGLDGVLSSRRLYWNIGTVDSDGYSTAWLSSDGTASGTSYKIKNFSFLFGTQNADTVWLSPTTTVFLVAGAGDSVIGDSTSKGFLGFTSGVTLTFAGSNVVGTLNHYDPTETRAYSISGTSAKYQNINSLGGLSGQPINIILSGPDPTQGYSPGTVAVPTIADESNSGTLDMRGMGGANGVAFVAGSHSSSSFGALGRGMSLPYLNSLALLSLSTTAVIFYFAVAATPGGLHLNAVSLKTCNGTNHADVLVAGFGKATLNAGDGNDILYSIDAVRYSASQVMYDDDTGDAFSSGSDVLNGGAGNDVFFRIVDAARSGKTAFRDVIDGGGGINTLVLAPSKKSDGTALNTDSEDTIRQSAVLGTDAPVRDFFGSTSYSGLLTTGGLASIASGASGTMGATLKNIQNVMVGGGGFVADDKGVANQYWFTGTAKNAEKTAAAMLFNDDNSTETDTVTVYGGNLLVYFDGLGKANINQTGGTYSIGSVINNQPININPSTGVSETLGSGQVSLFALGDVGNANGRSVTVDLSGSTGAGGTLQYSGGGGVNKIWRPAGGADDDIYAIYTTAKGDTITGDAFGNIFFTGGGKDTVSVGAGKDTVYAAGGEATSLNLGNDNDVLEAAFYKTSVTANTSTVDGGAGTDSLQFGLTNTGWSQPGGGRQILGVDWNAVGVDLDLTTGKATGTSLLGTGNTINFSNFENFHLTNGADTVTVSDGVMSGLTSSNLIDASPLRVGGIYESATTTGYSPAGYNGANSNEKFFASNNTSIVDTIKYTGPVGVDASDFVTKGFKSFEKIDLKGLSLSSGNTSFDVKVSDILALSESRTLIIERNTSLSITVANDVGGWSGSVGTTTSGAQVYTFTKSGEQNVVLAITG